MSHVPSKKQAEIDSNLRAFLEAEAKLTQAYPGKHVLMRTGKVVEAFDTAIEAQQAGEDRFGDGVFSVQEVGPQAGDLGFYSHALYLWRS